MLISLLPLADHTTGQASRVLCQRGRVRRDDVVGETKHALSPSAKFLERKISINIHDENDFLLKDRGARLNQTSGN